MEEKRSADTPVCKSGERDVKRGGQECPHTVAPLKLYGQEYTADTWAMACMNRIIHAMEDEIDDTFKNPKFRTFLNELMTAKTRVQQLNLQADREAS